ncbi:MAG: Kelch repeat-containing protein [Candidatus Hodarchaeota archaeon]
MWLFGGYGNDTSTFGRLNDLWRYDVSTGYWTWISGSNTANQVGTYGAQGTPAASNVPGARQQSISWIDASGDLWLFGGGGYSASPGAGALNDLWWYDNPLIVPEFEPVAPILLISVFLVLILIHKRRRPLET